MLQHFVLLASIIVFATAEHILTSQVFVIPIKPDAFDWVVNGKTDRYSYQPSLSCAPDLPPWIHYTYSKTDHHGYLYGVAPRNQGNFDLKIVALDKKTYDTRYKVLKMNVTENSNFPKYQVQLKIDNLKVEDLFDKNRTETLFDVFRKDLWKEVTNLQLTFLVSAVELGARLPLEPGEGEGVVLRLGSPVPFSTELLKLEEQVKPLRKQSSCPHKRTSVERLFRDGASVNLDWCYFRLIEENQNSRQESARRDPNMNVIDLPSAGVSERSEWRWTRPTKAGVPKRSYLKEIATTVFTLALMFLIMVALLSATLCVHHEKLEKRESSPVEGLGNNGVQMVQYPASNRGNTLKSLSAQPVSPCDSLSHSPRTSVERCNPYIRPNPPPYMGSNNFANIRADS